jgi:hypothetical protein
MKKRILTEAILDVIDKGHEEVTCFWHLYEHPDHGVDEAKAKKNRLEFADAVIERYRELFRIDVGYKG